MEPPCPLQYARERVFWAVFRLDGSVWAKFSNRYNQVSAPPTGTVG